MRTCSSDVWKRSSMAYRTDVDQVDIAGSPTRIRTTRGATSSIGPAALGAARGGNSQARADRRPAGEIYWERRCSMRRSGTSHIMATTT